jgi:RNA polymerase-interacting CarD/CdnL/TRCF family regulator
MPLPTNNLLHKFEIQMLRDKIQMLKKELELIKKVDYNYIRSAFY